MNMYMHIHLKLTCDEGSKPLMKSIALCFRTCTRLTTSEIPNQRERSHLKVKQIPKCFLIFHKRDHLIQLIHVT